MKLADEILPHVVIVQLFLYIILYKIMSIKFSNILYYFNQINVGTFVVSLEGICIHAIHTKIICHNLRNKILLHFITWMFIRLYKM